MQADSLIIDAPKFYVSPYVGTTSVLTMNIGVLKYNQPSNFRVVSPVAATADANVTINVEEVVNTATCNGSSFLQSLVSSRVILNSANSLITTNGIGYKGVDFGGDGF